MNSRGKIPTRGLTHRDIGTRGIGILEVEKFGAFQFPKQQNGLDQPFVQTHGGNREPVSILATGVLS